MRERERGRGGERGREREEKGERGTEGDQDKGEREGRMSEATPFLVLVIFSIL